MLRKSSRITGSPFVRIENAILLNCVSLKLFLNKKNIIGRDSNTRVIFSGNNRIKFVKNAEHSNDDFVVILVIREIKSEFAIRELFKIE